MNEAAAAQPDLPIGPRMRSFMSLVGLACGVYLAADKHRRARLAGVEVKPQSPLEAVLAQSGVEFPNLEAVLAKFMGDTPEAREAATIIVNNPDPGRLIEEFSARSAAPKKDGGSTSTTPPTGAPTPPPSAGPSAESASSASPPPTAAPSTLEPPAASHSAHPGFTAPQPSFFGAHDYAPTPTQGTVHYPAYRPEFAPQGAAYRPEYAPTPDHGHPFAAYRPEYAPTPHQTPPFAAYRPEYAPTSPPPGIPPLPTNRPPQPHHPRSSTRFHPPPISRRSPTPRPASRPSAEAAPRPPLPPLPQRPRPTPPTTAPQEASPHPSDAANSGRRTFVDWIKKRLEAIERAEEAQLAKTRLAIAKNRGVLAAIQRQIDGIDVPRSPAAPGAVDVDARARDDAATVGEDASTTSQNPATERAAPIDAQARDDAEGASADLEIARDLTTSTAELSESGVNADAEVETTSPSPAATAETYHENAASIDEHDVEPSSADRPEATLVDYDDAPALDPTPLARTLKLEALSLFTFGDRDRDEPPLPTPIEMAEAVHLFQLHEERMRGLAGIRDQELADHSEEIRRVQDLCTALVLVEASRASQASP